MSHFSAALVPQASTAPLCYQKFTVIAHADIFVSNDTLTHVFAQKLGSATNISNFKVVNTPGRATLSGTIKKIVPIEFSISGPISTDGVGLSLQADKIKADGIPIKALLGLIGDHLSSVLGLKTVPGVSVQDNTLSFLPEKIAHIKGHIVGVECTADGLILHYGRKPVNGPAPVPVSHSDSPGTPAAPVR